MSLSRTARAGRLLRGRALSLQAVGGAQGLRAEGGVRVERLSGETALFVGAGVLFGHHARLALRERGAVIDIGDGTFVNHRSEIVAHERVTIGRGCLVAWDVLILDSDSHRIDGRPHTQPVCIGDNVWIGCRATILKGVTIGHGAIVAAGSVVVADVPAGSLVGGNPARVLRETVTWQQ